MPDLKNLPRAPWKVITHNGEFAIVNAAKNSDGSVIIWLPSWAGEDLVEFIAMARNAFDGDPAALEWWEANRRRRT